MTAKRQALIDAIRLILITLGGILSAQGFIAESTVTQIIGAITVIIPAVWSIWDVFHTETKAQAREVNAVQAGIAAAVDPTNAINTPDVSPQTAKAVISTYGAKP